VILDNDDNLDKARTGDRLKALPVKSIPGVLNWTRVFITPFQPQNSPRFESTTALHTVTPKQFRSRARISTAVAAAVDDHRRDKCRF